MTALLGNLPHFIHTLLSFALVLGILVFVHELGHYLAARAGGVRVEAFAIGFGRPIASWTDKRGTVWKLGVLPLGGYVKMRASDEDEVAPNPGAPLAEGMGLLDASLPVRAMVAAAGPAANFLLAMVLFAGLFATLGREIPLAVVGAVSPHGAAEQAGLKTGDQVLAVDGQPVRRFEEMRARVMASPGQTLHFSIKREAAVLAIDVHVQAVGTGARAIGRLGVGSGAVETEHLSVPAALVAGVTQTWDMLGAMLAGLGHLVSTGEGADDLGGPIRISAMSEQAVSAGLVTLVSFIAMLSVNLGMVNLLPIPVLDGGHLMFYLAEAVRGKPLPEKAQEYGYQVGFALIASVFVFISWNDLAYIGVFRWVAGLIG